MPAVIAVKVKQAPKNTQKTSDRKEIKNPEAKSSESRDKVLNSDFKKILDNKISKKISKDISKKALKKFSEGKTEAADLKKADKKKINPEKLTEKQSEALHANMQVENREIKADNLINFDADLNEKTASAVKDSADKNSRIASASGLTIKLESISGKTEKNRGSEIKKITGSDKETEKSTTEKKEDVKLHVLDLRTKNSSQPDSENRFSGADGNSDKFELLSENSDQKTEINQFKDALFIKAEPAADIKESSVKSLTQQQTAVLEKLKADGNNEIVKQTKMILNDSNSGELRMVLKPERLGFVRIRLNLDDNNIVGRIIVDNNNIKEIFENNMDSLLKNFKESGFGSASLEVSVGGGKNQQQNMDNNKRFFSKKIIEDVDSRNIVSRNGSMSADTIIDLVV